MNLGRTIKELRKSKGLSQAELANAIGSTQSFLSLMEAGKADISHATLKAVSEALITPLPAIYIMAIGREDVMFEDPSLVLMLEAGKKLILQAL